MTNRAGMDDILLRKDFDLPYFLLKCVFFLLLSTLFLIPMSQLHSLQSLFMEFLLFLLTLLKYKFRQYLTKC